MSTAQEQAPALTSDGNRGLWLTGFFASLETVPVEPLSLERALAMGPRVLFSGPESLEEKGTG